MRQSCAIYSSQCLAVKIAEDHVAAARATHAAIRATPLGRLRRCRHALTAQHSGSTCWSFIVAKCPRPMAGRGLESEWTGLRLCSLKAEMTLRYQCAAGATSAAFFLG